MQYQSISEAVAALDKLQRTMAAYNHAIGILYLDGSTTAPSDSWEGRSKTLEILSRVTYDLETNEENGQLYSYLAAHKDELDDVHARQLEVLKKSYDKVRKIPAEEYVSYQVVLSDAQGVWAKAKVGNDFSAFAPYLEKIVAFNRKFAGYYDAQKAPYDALLNEYEEGISMEVLDAFFTKLRETIVPLLAKIQTKPEIDDSFLYQAFPIDKQKEFSAYLMDVLGLDRSHCSIGETEHPFTTGFNNKDLRITTHYNENNFPFSMYSVIHEGGHALYEMGGDDRFNYTCLQGGASMGIHESQSRFYENLIGRSRAFIHAVFPKVCALFPEQMAGVSEEDFYKAVNKVEPSLIRTESDELTYALHIMVRYQIEKEMIDGTLAIADVPARWNALYKEYLGVDVPSDREGCLQDSHWSGGSIGYFPSYALGSAYGAQFLDKMCSEIGDIYESVSNGDISAVTAWLREHIHQYSSFRKPGEILSSVCGTFDGTYFTDYLTKKFSDLYDL